MTEQNKDRYSRWFVIGVLVACFSLLAFAGVSWGREITIVADQANGDTTTHIQSNATNTNYSDVSPAWGDNFRIDYIFIRFAHISDSILGDSIVDSAAIGFTMVSEIISANDTLFPLIQRVIPAIDMDTVTWDSAAKDPGGIIWATAGAGSAGTDVSASILCDSTDGMTVNDPSGTVFPGLTDGVAGAGDTLWFRVATDHADSLTNNWALRIAYIKGGSGTPHISLRGAFDNPAGRRPRIRLWTSAAPSAGGGNLVGILKE